MNEFLTQVKNGWNETSDSPWYRSLRSDSVIRKIAEEPASVFHPAVCELLCKFFPDLKGKKILLPSSGDNHAAFAFALLGAEVTSSDISERQLENAREISERLGLHIEYICDDTMQLSRIENDKYDLVYTSNGTHTWITDLPSMYQNIHRVLKSGGYSVMYDVHPFQRPFAGEPWEAPKIRKSYFDAEQYRHWRVQDLVNATVSSGFLLRKLLELKAVDASFWFSYQELIRQTPESVVQINDWEKNPMAALPAWISIVAQKA